MRFAETLLLWYEAHARHLPWRGTGNPYHVWLSEVILQQTRVSQGTSYYFRFLEQFPTIEALAAAPIDEVMKCWQGLGYYTRARNLHKAAQVVVTQHGGQLPADYEALRTLPGLGPYAAGAVASFAFNLPVPAIDGNGYRVLARVFGRFEEIAQGAGQRAFRELALAEMDTSRPADFNQALIDFGATQCLPGVPDCAPCPMRASCYAYAHEQQGVLPVKARKIELRKRYFHYVILLHEGKTYLELRRGRDIWHSLYQFPLIETPEVLDFASLRQTRPFEALVGMTPYTLRKEFPERVQKLTHQELHLRFFVVDSPVWLTEPYQQVRLMALPSYQVPIAIARVVEELLAWEQGELR